MKIFACGLINECSGVIQNAASTCDLIKIGLHHGH